MSIAKRKEMEMGLLAMLAAGSGTKLLGDYLNRRAGRKEAKRDRQQAAMDRLTSSLSGRRGGGRWY